jgi:ribose transport system ATP-binding protein
LRALRCRNSRSVGEHEGGAGAVLTEITPEVSSQTVPPTATGVLLELKGISKFFGSVRALNNVDFVAQSGEVHAIVGENGAGKSTLVTIAAGALQADCGSIAVRGKRVSPTSVRILRRVGISIAYQHPALPPDLTVSECIGLVAPRFASRASAAEVRSLTAKVATSMLSMRPDQRIAELTLAQRHVVEIARALSTNPHTIVLDEPTEPLQDADVRMLFELIADLKHAGKAIVYISHRLNDVKQIADRISILRDGELVETRKSEEFSPSEIIDLIVGRPLAQQFPTKGLVHQTDATSPFTVSHASGAHFNDVSLDVRPGEIVGLVGVEGQGQREFIRAIAGADKLQRGEIRILGQRLVGQGAITARAAGIGFVPDDRHQEGLFLPLSVRENLTIGQLPALAPNGVVSAKRERSVTGRAIETFGIKTSGLEARVATLSGGNQQKVLLGREIAAEPRALLVDEPTKGVDVGSRSEIYQRLRGLSRTGVPILVCSSDGVELEGLCDRVLVFARGRIIRELAGREVTDANITEANLKATASRDAEAPTTRWSRLSRISSSVYLPMLALTFLIAVVCCGAALVDPGFLSPLSIGPALTLLSILILVSFAQLSAILIGEFDLSVGPLTGLVVVLASFAIPAGASPMEIVIGSVEVVLICTAVGFLQGLAIFGLRLPSIVVTLATFFGFQGFGLLLRPLPGGLIEGRLLDALAFPVISCVPAVFVGAIGVGVGLEWVLLRRPSGREARAVGSDLSSALKLGVNQMRVGLVAFTVGGLLTGLAGLILAAEVGDGIAGLGIDYTLMSVTAVVLGGASITGGRGSFIATLFGAILIQAVITATPFLQLGSEWNYWITGATMLLAAGLFGLARSSEASR